MLLEATIVVVIIVVFDVVNVVVENVIVVFLNVLAGHIVLSCGQ